MFEQHHLTCFDDLSSFTGEVLLMDGSISNNPIRVLNMPAERYYYGLYYLTVSPVLAYFNASAADALLKTLLQKFKGKQKI